MNLKAETVLGIIGGGFGILLSIFIFYVALVNAWPGGSSMMYAVPEIFGYSNPTVIMLGFGLLLLALGLAELLQKRKRKRAGY